MQASISWKLCAELPSSELDNGRGTVINGKVYCGGMTEVSAYFLVYCYDPSEDKWTPLPPLPVKSFGLGQVNGKLVAVGGERKDQIFSATNEVHTFNKRLQVWNNQTVPPMPTARVFVNVLSLPSALIVTGGLTQYASHYVDAVEIFKPDTSQWYRADPLPRACCHKSLVAIGNMCYALGGYVDGIHFKEALYASVDDLLGNAVPANQTTHSGSSDTQSAWKTLPSTPKYRPAAAVLAGNLFAVGGQETCEFGMSPSKSEIYMYSSFTKSWILVSDLPAPRSGPLIVVLSPMEILVIGGMIGGRIGDWFGSNVGIVNTVYKGTLHLE